MNPTTDKTTLRNVTGVTAPFLLLNSSRPEIGPTKQSGILSRLRSFLPEIEQANNELDSESCSEEVIQIEKVVTEDNSSSSDSDSDSDSDVEPESMKSKTETQCIQMDVNLFKDLGAVDNNDIAVEDVDNVPIGFQDDKAEEPIPKKIIVEELL